MVGVVARWRASYAPGQWFVLAGPTSVLVLDPSTDPALITELWGEVVASASIVELADRLAGYRRDQLPSLGAFFWSVEGMRSLVRGGVAVVDLDSGKKLADGQGILTWSEVGLGDTTRASIQLSPGETSGGRVFPLVVGVVQASAVSLDASPGAEVVSPQVLDAAPDAVEMSDEAASAQVPVQEVSLEESPAAEPVVDEPIVEAATELADVLGAEPAGAPDAPMVVPPAPPTPAAPGPPLIGQEIEWGQWGSLQDTLEEPTAPVLPAAAPPAPGTEPAPDDGDHTLASEPATPLDVVDLDTADTQMMEAPHGPTLPAAVPGQRSIPAVMCPRGHANSPSAPACRICRAPIAPQQPTPVAQPLLARLRCIDGTVADLDRTVLIGRAPSEQSSDAVLPRLMSVPSPGGDISRTHVQVSPAGWSVLVTDLHSTNGTSVLRADAGGMRQVLNSGEPTEVPVGSVLELGDGVTVLIDFPT